MKKIKVAMYINHPSEMLNACTMYRNINPLKYLKKYVEVRYVHKVETRIDYQPLQKRVTNMSIEAEPIEWADVVVFSRHYDQIALMGVISEIAQRLGKTIIYETDDLLHRVKDNVGGHRMEGSGITKAMRFVDYLLPRANMVTVSTDALKRYYGKDNPNTQIVTLPNYYDPAMWRGLYAYKKIRDIVRKKILGKKKVRIGWQGGNNHFLNNFNYIVEPLNRLNKQYGMEFEFVSFSGMHPNVDLFGGEKDKRKFLDFEFVWKEVVPLKQFPRGLAEADIDIGLIVVEDNEFSRAKSNIKWMEYALLGIPAISSRCEPYLDTNAILVDNSPEEWFSAMEDLLLDPEKRAKIGREARKLALDFNIKKHAYKWVEAYQKAMEAKPASTKVGDLEKLIK